MSNNDTRAKPWSSGRTLDVGKVVGVAKAIRHSLHNLVRAMTGRNAIDPQTATTALILVLAELVAARARSKDDAALLIDRIVQDLRNAVEGIIAD
jgi:hypothetical protein